MEGTIKKWTSLFHGYQDRWVVLIDGYLKYFETEPGDLSANPKGKLRLTLSDIYRKDDCRFKVIADDGQKFYFKAESEEQADQWIAAIEQVKSTVDHDILNDPEDEEMEEADEEDGVNDKNDEIDSEDVTKEVNVHRNISLKDVVRSVMSAEQITAQFRRLMIDRKRKNFKVVAAIDFGSSYTGCAFSFKSEYKKEPLNLHTVALGEGNSRSNKEPTVLLLNPEGQFDSFGSKAEEKFTELQESDPEGVKNWYLFRKFKMQLYNNQNLSKLLMLNDIGDKPFRSVDVFALCIEYIHEVALKAIQDENHKISDYDVRWVLTCPAIWNESARQFMIEAAEKGGIDQKSITLVLEPEAAAICCQCLEAEKKLKGSIKKAHVFSPESRFLIVDLGGDTVDITANEVIETGQLKEIYNASGGQWGGSMINKKIWILIYDIFGHAVINKFMNEYRDEYLQMVRAVEIKKQTYDFDDKFTIDIPEMLLDIASKLNAELIYDKNKDLVKISKSRLYIDSKLIYEIFKDCIDTLCRHIKDIIQKDETEGVSSILLVGGFSSCELLRKTVKENFPEMNMVCPSDPDTIVLKGAVIMGHMDTPIVRRLARYHYGMAVNPELDLSKSFSGALREIEEAELEFRVFIRKGDPIKVNDVITEYDLPVNEDQEKIVIEVYASELEVPPPYVSDHHCRKIGTIRIKLSGIRDGVMKIGFSCDGTEFKAVARDSQTGRCFAGVCRFLE